ncbi:CapA family protein [Brevibacillus fluminis]|uniref:CapA family protein n=1 Tax=Brevibacillus fluminis TaxID=511487 RepID=A0A3M8DUN5_9BACL|nr:CapA family protein [Brevibacillus fluminis]RNB90677.1 CapA family protein [Brevibacillus fluminis]
MSKTMTFAATGDSFITRSTANDPDQFARIAQLLQEADACFTNLETTVHDNEGYPGAFSGGTWAMSPPQVLHHLKEYGFNLIGWANNHTLDYLYGGLEATERYLNQYEFVHAGAGKNLAEASAPRYLDLPAGRVALIAATSTFHPWWVAGEQRADSIGRPGINPMRYLTQHAVSLERLQQLKEIADTVDINAVNKVLIEEGFMNPPGEGIYLFGNARFVEGAEEKTTTVPHPRDLKRMLDSIREAKRRADYVLVSLHVHEMKGADKEVAADFVQTVAHACIDAGAHAIIGHGPHIVRGIELYRKRPIFYSLGDFIFQTETVSSQPADFYEFYGLCHTHRVADALEAMSANYSRGLCVHRDVWESVIPVWKMADGELTELLLYPIELGFDEPIYRMGCPALTHDTRILESLQRLSAPYGTTITIEDGVGKIRVD